MLDENDLALVHALQEAPRASWALLSAVLGIDSRTLVRRYTRLHETGLLRVMATAGPRLLDQIVFAHLRLRTEPGRASAVAHQLAEWPQASTIRLTDGSHDVYAMLTGTDHAALVREAHEKVATLPLVRQMEINTVLQTGDVGRAARLDALSPRQVAELRGRYAQESRASASTRLSTEDFEILRLLLREGRRDIAELATALDRDPSAVSRRVARLQRDQIIDIVALTPDTASSAPVRALLWCTIAPQELHSLVRQSANLPWIGLLTATTGHANVFLVANVKTRALLPAVQTELSSLCPSLQLRETQLSAQALKLHMRSVTPHDRLTDEVADPFWELRHELVRS